MRPSRPIRLLLLWGLLLYLGTLHPFTLDWRPVTVPSDSFWVPRLKGLDPAFNVLLFLPVGLVVRCAGGRWWAALLGGLFISASVELSQHFIAFRVPVFEDLVFNTAGALLGFFAARPLLRAARALEVPTLRVPLAAAAIGLVLFSAAPPEVRPELWAFRCDAPFNLGAEASGAYAWPGTVHHAALYAGARGPEALDDAPVWSSRRDPRGPSPEACASVLEAGAFTLAIALTAPLEVPPSDDPLRIFAWSSGVQRRNVLLGQDGAALILRVATRATPLVGRGTDGDEPLRFPAPPPGASSQVVVAFSPDDGLDAWVDGQRVAHRVLPLALHNGLRFFWLPRGPLGLGLYAFSAALVSAAVASVLGLRRAFLVGLAVAALTEVLQLVMFDRGLIPWSMLPMLLGAALGAWTAAPEPTGRAERNG